MRRPSIVILISERTVFLIAIALLAGAGAYLAAARAVATLAPIRDVVSGRVVAIDAGHGGPDGGAVGRTGIREKDINLHIASELQKMLSRCAVYTVMTREDDDDLLIDGEDIAGSRKRAELERRAQLVNSRSPDIFVTIHSNSFPEPQWSGAQVFYNPASEEGRRLAEHLQAELVRRLGPNTRKARPADIYLLRRVSAPSALVEVGFLSNPREERLLSDPGYRVKVADAVYHGIVSYLMDAHERAAGAANGSDWGIVRRVTTGPEGQSAATDLRQALAPDAATGSAPAPTADSVVLYFGGPTNFEDSLMPESRDIPGLRGLSRNETLTAVVECLISGPGRESILQPTIPKGTVLRWARLEADTAVVNLSSEVVSNHWGGSRGEELTAYSIVDSLTELPYVKKVKLLVEGHPLETITGHVDLEGALERNLSIVQFRM